VTKTFFTSDTHFSHTNIIRYCDRPFADTDEMDEAIIANWNAVVSPDDTVYHLGDIALGPIDKSLAKVARLNGHKIAVLGNHDRPFMRMGKADEDDWWRRYNGVFQHVWSWEGGNFASGARVFRLSHFPYTGDHTPTDRHAEHRPVDEGIPLIHGHTHTTDRVTFSKNGTPQIHVGQDAWNFTPVSLDEIFALLDDVA
jgi:calcineurin-like phosphoesterase family protein